MDTFENYLHLLKKIISFKSISTDITFKKEMSKTANFLKGLFKENGFKVKLLSHPNLNPVVLANYYFNDSLPTLLIYGHYDVQPASEEEWGSNPFQLRQENGRLYGRGVVDNKGQILIHIASAFELIKVKKLGYNLKFFIEGNEETGSIEELVELMKKNRSLLKADYILISDGELVGKKPTIEASFRGGFNARLEYTVAKTDVHSGIYGGAVTNAIQQLSTLINKLVDENNQIKLPGFYNDVDEITLEEIQNNQKLFKMAGDPSEEAGFKKLRLAKGDDFYTATGLYPTIQVTGIKGGYIGDGFANIVPARAEARFNFRLVSSQKSRQIYEQFARFVKENTPADVEYHLEAVGFHEPVKLNVNQPIFNRARKILEEVYQPPILYHYVGGAIPFIGTVKEMFGVDSISVGLANQDCHMHGVNENFRLDLVEKGLKFSYRFLQ